MLQRIKQSYEHTIFACYIGYIVQAIVNNLAPLLFLTFRREFGLSVAQIAFITTANFVVQILTDLVVSKYVERIGYRVCMMAAHVFAVLGLTGMALFPAILPDPYVGLLLAAACYAIGGGIVEVLVSPIVEACPTKHKEAMMSLLHSFYCWGHVAVVLCSVAFFQFVGIVHWRWLACLWAIIPLLNFFYFTQVPLFDIVPENVEGMNVGQLFKQKIFWVLLLLMLCSGSSEHAMSQWSSAFAEEGLGVSKTIGDLAGPCMFAVLMGTSRTIYGKFSEKIPLRTMMITCSVTCVAAYLLAAFSKNPLIALFGCGLCGFSVGIFWPGSFSMAAKALPGGGAAMYGLLALAGDLGCASGPTVVGLVTDVAGKLSIGYLVAVIFPVLMLIGLFFYRRQAKKMKLLL